MYRNNQKTLETHKTQNMIANGSHSTTNIFTPVVKNIKNGMKNTQLRLRDYGKNWLKSKKTMQEILSTKKKDLREI